MGKYTNAIDIRKLYKEVESGDLNDEDIEFYVRMAESEVDGFVAKRYTLPFSLTPQLIRDVSSELSLIKILDRYFTSQAQDENEQRNVRKREVTSLLTKISSGTMCLVNSDGTVISPAETLVGISSDTSQYTPTFGTGPVILEEVDLDRIEDEENERL